jgi:signal transduction histidine kinase
VVSCLSAWLDALVIQDSERGLNLWSVAGVGMAGMLVFGWRVWPGVLVGVLCATWFKLWQSADVGVMAMSGVAIVVAAGKTAAVTAGWYGCARWLVGSREDVVHLMQKSLLEGRAVIPKYVFVGLAVTLPGCIIGVLGACGLGVIPWSEAMSSLGSWWCSDATSLLVVTPALVLLIEPPRHPALRTEAAIGERVAAFALLLVVCWFVFLGMNKLYSRPFAVVLPLVWIALRHGLRSTAFAVGVLGLFVVWSLGTGSGRSPLHALGFLPAQAVIYLWVMALTGLTVAANVAVAKHARIALREVNETLEAAMAAIPAVVFASMDAQSNYVKGNPAAREMLGVIGQEENLSLNHAGNPVRVRSECEGKPLSLSDLPMRKAMSSGAPVCGAEIDLVTSDGEVRSLFGNAVPLFGENRAVRGCVSAFVDITARRRAEADLRRLNEELEQRVAERTAELQQANVNLAQVAEERRRLKKEILEISEREERRLGMQMHEGIGQQIAGIGFLCKVVAGRLSDEGHSEASNASQLVTLLQEAIDSIRDLAKSAYPIELETGGLAAALRGLAERTGRMFDIECVVNLDDHLPIFHDEEASVHIYRIAQEALTNIVKHGKARHVSIEQRRSEDGDSICIVDDGVGFDPPVGSPGMGLHLMDYRARLIGAKLSVSKNNGRGCIVRCDLKPTTGAVLSSMAKC